MKYNLNQKEVFCMCDALFEFLQLLPLKDYIITKVVTWIEEVR